MTAEEIKIYVKIDEILYSDWNPIEVDDLPGNEYQSYNHQIFALKKEGSGIEVIAQALYKLETGRMGLTGNIEYCSRVARKIFNL